MKKLLNPRVQKLQVPGIRQFSNLVSQYPHAVNLTIGQPDFSTPEHVKQAGITAISQNHTAYTHNAGLSELRKAAADFVRDAYGLDYHPEQEVLVTVGASEALDAAFRTILEEGDEVILPAPIYPGYEPLIELCGGTPVYVDTTENHFKLSVDLLKERWSDKTKCVVLNSPSNPTGVVMPEQDLRELAAFLQTKDVFVVSDEIYSENVYGKQHVSIASFPGMRRKTIVINGLSKSHSMTGWRIGFAFAPAEIAEEMVKVHLYNTVCAPTMSQYAAIEALTNGRNDPAMMNDQYAARRDYVQHRLQQMGFEVVQPEGAFYIFPSIQSTGMTSHEFAFELLSKGGVAVVPGSAFSMYGEGYVRLSYAYSLSLLKEGLNRMEQFVELFHARKGAL
jgi:aminotransferase